MLRIENFEEGASQEGTRANLDLLEEQRAEAHLQSLAYKRVITKLYNARGKLAPNWEGPYRVTEVIQDETYKLNT
ncbi:hypothetical protein BHE74_00047584 [Ensete ventricosum]|nr:hypothetical protein BHE74_00047584 [Ensete ventricosum]